jgi:hypothetical protein
MLKRLKARAIRTEPESVDGPEAFALPTMKKWRRHFHQSRTDLFDDPMFGRPLTNDIIGTTYNTQFLTDAVMPSLIEILRSPTRIKTLEGRLIHMDNARPHNSGRTQNCIEASRAKCLLHPADSPDRVSNDFLLFRYVKLQLSDYNL